MERVQSTVAPSHTPERPRWVHRALAVALGGASALSAAAGQSTVRGSVLTTRGMPLRGAQVRMATDSTVATKTDDAGRFVLSQVPDGVVTLEVRAIGYVPESFDLSTAAASDVTLRVALQPVAMTALGAVTTTARPGSSLMAGFWTRRERESGVFLTREEIGAHNSSNAIDLLRAVPGVRMRVRGQSSMNTRVEFDRCRDAAVFLDGQEMKGDAGSALQMIDARSIEAAEVYIGASRMPMAFRATDKCAAIVLWTRIH